MALVVHTARVSYRGPDRLDVTAKSGVAAFAPSWALLRPYLDKRHAGGLTLADWHSYAAKYRAEMLDSMERRPDQWTQLLARDRVVLCCYCTVSDRCHRRLLAEFLVGEGAVDAGELAAAQGRLL